jgi:hypothetical protein
VTTIRLPVKLPSRLGDQGEVTAIRLVAIASAAKPGEAGRHHRAGQFDPE